MHFGIGIIVFLADQLVKWYVDTSMYIGQSIPVIDNIFHITYILNPGAAFGMLEHKRWIFIIVALVIMAATIYCYRWIKQESSLIRCGIGLLLGGAAGNLLDRIQTGLVVDFLDFRVWPVFNIADIGICVGAGMLMFSVWRRRNEI